MQKRLCGREQEFGMRLIIHSPYYEYYFKDRSEKILLKLIKLCSKITPAFLEGESHCWFCNGALMYRDGEMLEAATAEYFAGSLDGVLQEKAMELILNQAIKKIAKPFSSLVGIRLYKNNVGPKDEDIKKEASYGSHHNYSFLIAEQKKICRLLQNFIPAALPLSGNGHVLKLSSGESIYCISQKARHIIYVKGGGTTRERPIIHFKDESLRGRFFGLSRLHLISRDATRCEFQTWLVDAITHLVLRLGEEDYEFPSKLSLVNPVKEMHQLNVNSALDYKLQTASRRIDVIAYNKLFLNLAKQLNPLSENEKKCLEEWERVLELLEAGAFEKLVGELDWVTKWHLLKNKMKKYGFGLNDIRAWKINMGYHDISSSPKQSWFALLEEEGYIKHLVTKSDIKKAITTPPETRAKRRSEFIRRCKEKPSLLRGLLHIDWDRALFDGGKTIFFE